MEASSPERLAEWIAEYPKYVRSRDAFEVPAENGDGFLLLVGMALRIARSAEAYLVLVDSGHSLEATPLARAAFEHAVTLQWIFVTPAGLSQFRNQVDANRIAYFKRLNQWLKSDDVADGVQKLKAPATAERLPSFQQIIGRADGNDGTLRALYDLLSQQAHVTFGALTEHLEDVGNGRVGIVHDPPDPMEHGTLYSLAFSCMLAWSVLAELIGDDETLARLDRDSSEFSIPTRLTFTSRHRKRGRK